jgi:hypothetical protein
MLNSVRNWRPASFERSRRIDRLSCSIYAHSIVRISHYITSWLTRDRLVNIRVDQSLSLSSHGRLRHRLVLVCWVSLRHQLLALNKRVLCFNITPLMDSFKCIRKDCRRRMNGLWCVIVLLVIVYLLTGVYLVVIGAIISHRTML